MLCIDNRITDIYFNLAAEEYFLKNSQENIFMLWQSDSSIVIGKHQDVFNEVNTDFAENNQIKIARRFSGGGAVYHDLGNLNLTFIETNAQVNFDDFSERITRMLASLGIKAMTDERRGLHVDGLKISGSAQSIHKNRVLYHATLLISSDLKKLTTSLEGLTEHKTTNTKSRRKVTVQSVKSPVTNLSEHLPQPIDLNSLKNYIIDYYKNLNSGSRIYELSPKDIDNIDELKSIKYANQTWIYDSEILKK